MIKNNGEKSNFCDLFFCFESNFLTGFKRGSEILNRNLNGPLSLRISLNSQATLKTSTTCITPITARNAITKASNIPMVYFTQENTPLFLISSFKSPVISIDAGVARKIPLEIF